MPNNTSIPALRVPLIDQRTGLMAREWFRYFQNPFTQTGADGSTASIQDIELAGGVGGVSLDSVNLLQTQVESLQAAPVVQATEVVPVSILAGTGSPNTVVVGYIGDLYLNLSGGASTTLYVKESGAGTNTGWVAK